MSFYLSVLLSCTLLCFATCGAFPTRWTHHTDSHDTTGLNKNGDPLTKVNLSSVCTDSQSFCFPSTLPGVLSDNKKLQGAFSEASESWSDDQLSVEVTRFTRTSNPSCASSYYGLFKLTNGISVSCSHKSGEDSCYMSSVWAHSANKNDLSSSRGPLEKKRSPASHQNGEKIKFSYLDNSSPHVEISPAILDWGQSFLYFPSYAYLTVANTCNHSVLHVYEPFSSNRQFYSCNDSGFIVGSGEVASICFVFLPGVLGLSSSQLLLQTSSGGFLVQAKGLGIESPYGFQSLIGLDVSSSGRWNKKFSLLNPFEETFYVDEVTLCKVVSSRNSSCTMQKFCRSDGCSLLTSQEWLEVGSQLNFCPISTSPHRTWAITPHCSQVIIEVDLSFDSGENCFGALCMQLLRPSQDKIDTVIIPLEAELDGKAANDGISDSISVLVEALVPCDASETLVFALSLESSAPYLLSIVKISEVTENTKLFQIKYVEGLIIFPNTVTKVAVLTYSHLPDFLSAIRNINGCKLLIMTNNSIDPRIEFPCQDVLHACPTCQLNNYSECMYGSEMTTSGKTRLGTLDSSGIHSHLGAKVLEVVGADEIVLGNWKAQGMTSDMSVLDDHEVLFPVVTVGSYHSKWITVKNPTEQPVVMQLILNSGEIIDECKGSDGSPQLPSSTSLVHNESTAPTRYGFSIVGTALALTEVYVHPHGRARVGPVFFQPSNRCRWRSSALIRNNLSGVESISLRGFGGSHSLVLLEGTKTVQSLEFHGSMPTRRIISQPDMFQEDSTSSGCYQLLTKEFNAKNMGDMPLEVKRIEVSGTQCGLDGFIVHTCKGFTLEPGESRRLLISYHADFSAAVVRRDLELAMATGILVIPMMASLPHCMLNLCEESNFWLQVKKSTIACITAASLMSLVCWLLPQAMMVSQGDLKGLRNSVSTVRYVEKSSHRGNSPIFTPQIDNILRSSEEHESSLVEYGSWSAETESSKSQQGLTAQFLKPSLESIVQKSDLPDVLNERDSSCTLLSNSGVVKNCDASSQPDNLIVRTVKDKRKRRRKKKNASAGLTGFEVSSSQSGNSTPSSPLSPFTPTPKETWSLSPDVNHSVEAKNQFFQMTYQNGGKSVASEQRRVTTLEPGTNMKPTGKCSSSTQEQTYESEKPDKPVAIPSATSAHANRPAPREASLSLFAAPSSTSSLYPRAPGSKPSGQKSVLAGEESARYENRFTYDIWGDHFPGLHCGSRELYGVRESNSGSFFARGPQALGPKSQPRSVSCFNQEG